MIDDGIKSYNHYRHEKKYTLSLIYSIVAMVVSVCFAVSYIAIGANLAAYVQFLGAFVFMIIVGLLRRRIQVLTRYVAVVSSMLLVLIQTVWIFGEGFGFHYQIFPLVVVVFMLLDFNIWYEKMSAYVLSALGIGIFFSSLVIHMPLVGVSFTSYGRYYSVANALLSFVSTMLILHYISVEIFSTKDQLYQMATRDALTGLYNRRTFIQQGTSFFKIAQRGGTTFTILIFDIDDFKSVNDMYGHVAGDHFLKGLSRLCEESLRDSDFIARYGGEEFAVILHDTDETHAALVADKLRAVVEAYKLKEGAVVINRTISIGLATYDHDYDNFHDILDKGDKAMYMSKNSGKNKISVLKGGRGKK